MPAPEYQHISVQGSLFSLKKSREWMLSKILTSEIPFEKIDDKVYLDIDSICFRLIISVLQGSIDLDLALRRIGSMEIALLKSTTRYLLLDDLYEKLDGITGGFEEELAKVNQTSVDELSTANQKIEQYKHVVNGSKQEFEKAKMNAAKELAKVRRVEAEKLANVRKSTNEERQKYEKFEKRILKMRMFKGVCRGYRTHRSRNECGNTCYVFGDEKIDSKELRCICGEKIEVNACVSRSEFCIDDITGYTEPKAISKIKRKKN